MIVTSPELVRLRKEVDGMRSEYIDYLLSERPQDFAEFRWAAGAASALRNVLDTIDAELDIARERNDDGE